MKFITDPEHSIYLYFPLKLFVILLFVLIFFLFDLYRSFRLMNLNFVFQIINVVLHLFILLFYFIPWY